MVQSLSKEKPQAAYALSTAFLRQNIPNPSGSGTALPYHIPDNAGYAYIRITDAKGSLIKIFNALKGDGQAKLKAGELPA